MTRDEFDHDAILAEQGQRADPAVWRGYGAVTLLDERPTHIAFCGEGGKQIVRIYPTGKVELAEGYTPDAAARAFWDAVEATGVLRQGTNAPPSGHEGATLSTRLLNAAERICDGLEPREDVAALLVEAGRELGALEAVVEDAKRVFADKAAETLALRRKVEQGDPEAVRAALRRVLEESREDVEREILRYRTGDSLGATTAGECVDRIIAAIARRVEG